MASTLYVGNLPWATTPDDLTEAFSAHGQVISSRIITDRESGRSRGFGFVEVEEGEVEKLIEAMNGTELNARTITVNEAKPREDGQ